MNRSQSPRGPKPAAKTALLISGLMLVTLVEGCATFSAGGGGVLQDQIYEIISAPPLDQVNWGIRIVDPERGQILYNRHAHLKFVPASNMKILSTATALSLLGPDYRYETNLYGLGPISEGGEVLDGDLVLRATGDPTFSDRFYPSALAPLDSLAESLRAAGLRRVEGALVVDVSAWDSTTVPGTWMVEDLAENSAATGGAFSIAEGVLTVEVSAGPEVGAPAEARWWPHLEDESPAVDFRTIHSDSTEDRQTGYFPESGRLEMQGQIRVGEVDTIRISQRDPVRFASAALLRAIEGHGIEVQGGVRVAWDPLESMEPHAEPVASLKSPRMAEIVQAILEPSQNWMTEQLVRTLGMEIGEEGSWREGFRVEQEFLTQEVGVDSLDITYRDGSGLSAYNLVTPRALIRILEYMRASSNSGVFRNAMASPGEEDSTLRNRLLALESRIFAKTGTITHVNSLSGYVFTDSGRELIFSILTNGSGLPSGVVRAGIDRLMEALAHH